MSTAAARMIQSMKALRRHVDDLSNLPGDDMNRFETEVVTSIDALENALISMVEYYNARISELQEVAAALQAHNSALYIGQEEQEEEDQP